MSTSTGSAPASSYGALDREAGEGRNRDAASFGAARLGVRARVPPFRWRARDRQLARRARRPHPANRRVIAPLPPTKPERTAAATAASSRGPSDGRECVISRSATADALEVRAHGRDDTLVELAGIRRHDDAPARGWEETKALCRVPVVRKRERPRAAGVLQQAHRAPVVPARGTRKRRTERPRVPQRRTDPGRALGAHGARRSCREL